MSDFGVVFDDLTFWVIHRSGRHGPFDYQFSLDLNGIEMMYQGDKFGECCSEDEFCADLKPYSIPLKVSEVATVVLGAIIFGIFQGQNHTERREQIYKSLCEAEMARYAKGLKFN